MSGQGWIQTYSGRKFYPLAANWQDVYIEDIAHALACTARFGGHTSSFYSVAQHCWLASHVVPPEDAKWALLHDSPEAYLGDVPRPIKYSLGFDEYRAAEHRLMAVIAEAFDLPADEPPSVKVADSRLLVTEKRDLMARDQTQMSETEWLHGATAEVPLDGTIDPWDPETAERLFLARWETVRHPWYADAVARIY